MTEVQIIKPICDDDDDCEGKRGERGKRGKRGHRGRQGPSSPILHVEAQRTFLTPLPPNTLSTVLTCPAIVAPVGSTVQITASINYSNTGNTTGSTTIIAAIYQDGVFIGGVASATPGVLPAGGGLFDMSATLPCIWYLAGDGLSHVYTVKVQTDATTDGDQEAGFGAIFVNAIGP